MESGPMSEQPEIVTQAVAEFTAFYEEEYPRLTRSLIRQGASPAVAEDAAQHAMVSLWVQREVVTTPRAWLRTVAFRHFMAAKKITSGEESLGDHNPSTSRDDTDLIYETGCAFEVRYVREVLRGLPPEQRVVLALTIDKFSTAEIAQITGQKPATVRSNLRHARQKARAAIEQHSRTTRKEGTEWILTTPPSTCSTSAPSRPN